MTVHSSTPDPAEGALSPAVDGALKAEKSSLKADRAEAERAVKRERILDAAETIFAAYGFFAARVSQIAAEAGVADGTIYLYFKSKDDLLISLFESRMERVNSMLATAITGKEPRIQLREFVRSYLTLVHAEPAAAEVLTIELRQSSKFMNEYDNPRFADFLRVLAGIVAAGQQQGEFTSEIPPAVVARMIFGMLDELVTSWVLSLDKPIVASMPNKRDKSPQGTVDPSDLNRVRQSAHRPKKFDIVRAADWVVALVENGLTRRL